MENNKICADWCCGGWHRVSFMDFPYRCFLSFQLSLRPYSHVILHKLNVIQLVH